MTVITSESPNGKKRVVIDPSAKTVTFIGCYMPAPTSFFTLSVRPKQNCACPFADILLVYEHNLRQRGQGPRWMQTEITTTHGLARFDQSWSNYEEVKGALGKISASTASPPWHRNPGIVTRLIFLVALVVTVTFIALLIWFDVL